jgi:capsule polysaccharide export protein KpsE/RkpR
MNDFNRKVGETTARVSKTVSEAAERLEKDSTELIDYLNREVVPAVRDQSSKALRIAADKLHELADYMDEAGNSKTANAEDKKP